MYNFSLKCVGGFALVSFLLTGCVVREHYGYRHRGPVVVRETVVMPAPPPPPVAPPIAYYPPGPGEIVVTAPPPPPVVEVVRVAPAPYYVWAPGGWIWSGRWVWEPGRWNRPPRRGAVWVPHRYVNRGGVHVWIRGGWR